MRAVNALDAASRSEIAARNFDVGIIRKLAAAQSPLCNAFKLGSVQIIRLDAALGCRAFRENALVRECTRTTPAYSPTDTPNSTAERLGRPARVFGKGEQDHAWPSLGEHL